MVTKRMHGAPEWALMVALVFGAGAIAQAQEEQPQGPVVQIGKADEGQSTGNVERNDAGRVEQPATPKYWIGLAGAAIPTEHVLRAQLDIPENQGLLVASVVPDSPAAKAGLKQHDVLLRANDTELREMQDLVELVVTQGEKKEKISLDILRKGKHETVTLTPEERPADAPRPELGNSDEFGGGFGGIVGPEGLPQELLQRFQGRTPFEFRNFGPGVIVGGGQGLGNMPSGVSVNIAKEKGKPTHITVKRGEETWEVVGDDPESLEKLPEDLRPFVEQMLHGASPMDLHTGQPGRAPMPELGDGRLRERMERMEQRMQELMERLNENNRSTQEPSANDEQSK